MAKFEAAAKGFTPRPTGPFSTAGLITFQREDEVHRRCSAVKVIVSTTPMKDGRRRCVVCLEAHGSLHQPAASKKEEAAKEGNKKGNKTQDDKKGGKKNKR